MSNGKSRLIGDAEIAELLSISRSWVRKQRFNRRHGLPHVFDIDPLMVGSLRRLSSSPHASNYAPRVMAPMPASEGATYEALAAAMADLLQRGAIRVEHVGPPSRQHEKIVQVERKHEEAE